MPRLDLEASLIVPIINRKQTSAFLLLADVTADCFFLKTDGRASRSAGPEMLTREVALSALQPGHRDCALALEKTDDGRDRIFRRDLHHHRDVVGDQMSFNDSTLFLPCQFVKDQLQLRAQFPIEYLAATFGDKHDVVLANPFGMGQALIDCRPTRSPLVVNSSSHRRRTLLPERSKLAESSGRTSGLPFTQTSVMVKSARSVLRASGLAHS
jgi:hypothetical protein